eukprot:TRINITY_DN1757_c0_g1_i1.p1 TRINITY_DN1757_c0_g1~~TRINITY_DN1757_c0_g1_i1.p1  ORF type:complete len:202 (+),score=33.19 TRINITY_DN1757_c0_g1_i1:162-767(+)
MQLPLPRSIYLLTGVKNQGKTTRLARLHQHLQEKEQGVQVRGVIAPDIDAIRHVDILSSGERKQMQLQDGEKEEAEARGTALVSICQFQFYRSVFDDMSKEIVSAFAPDNANSRDNSDDNVAKHTFLFIDEIGPLELRRGDGLISALTQIMDSRESWKDKGTVVIVIRDSLIETLKERYSLQEDEVGMFEDLESVCGVEST